MSLPFYCGCPNAAEYFPAESFIPIDIRRPASAIATIRQAILNDEYTQRLPAIIEARRRVLDEHNVFAVIDREIQQPRSFPVPRLPGGEILSRHRLRRRRPLTGLRLLGERLRVRITRWRLRENGS